MNTKRHFAKCAFSDQFYELVKLKSSRWQLIRLLDVVLDVGNQLFNLLCTNQYYFTISLWFLINRYASIIFLNGSIDFI